MGSGFRTFTAGEVLTASNVQNYLMDQSVMVFGGSAARSSAIGTANFEEGMVSYLTDTDKVEAYNGTNWAQVGASAQGLTLINTTSFSAVSSFSLNADTFTSTYDNYRIYLNITTASTTVGYNVRFRAAGSDSSASQYAFYSRNSNTSTNSDTNTSNRNQTSGVLFNTSITTDTQLYVIDVMSPKLSQITALFYQSTGAVGNHNYGDVVFQTTTSFDSLSVFPNTGTFTGNFSVYGLAK